MVCELYLLNVVFKNGEFRCISQRKQKYYEIFSVSSDGRIFVIFLIFFSLSNVYISVWSRMNIISTTKMCKKRANEKLFL